MRTGPSSIILVATSCLGACVGEIGGRESGRAGAPPELDPSTATSVCGSELDVGVSWLQRLTRAQYHNAVRDLLHVEGAGATSLPPDEKLAKTFANNSTVPVDTLTVEAYQSAAESVAAQAVADLPSLLPCDPTAVGEDECAAQLVTELGRRAFRRPLEEIEIDELVALYAEKKAVDGFADAIRLVVQAVLQSPLFLYRVETTVPPPGEQVARLGDHEIATRLAFFLINSIPDDELLDAADAGDLATPEGLMAQAERMLADDRAAGAIAEFHAQWLGLGEIAALEKAPDVYPDFDAELAASMARETAAFADDVIRNGDGKLATLFTAPYSFVDAPLAALYGVPAPDGLAPGELAKVELPDGERAGLFTHASFLSTHAHQTQASPIKRGVFVLRNVVCASLPDPPPDVDVTPPVADDDASLRDKYDALTGGAPCNSCHTVINPVGYAFEAYDGIGRRHETEAGAPVDETGAIAGKAFDGPLELAEMLAADESVHECMVEQWFRFAVGRPGASQDSCTIDNLEQHFTESGLDVRALMLDIVRSDAFRFRRATEGAGE